MGVQDDGATEVGPAMGRGNDFCIPTVHTVTRVGGQSFPGPRLDPLLFYSSCKVALRKRFLKLLGPRWCFVCNFLVVFLPCLPGDSNVLKIVILTPNLNSDG